MEKEYEFEQFSTMLYKMLENAKTGLPKRTEAVGAVYFLLDETEKIVYVGKSNNVTTRCFQHSSKGRSKMHGKFTDLRYIEIETEAKRTFLESAYIYFLQPRYNHEVYGIKTTLDPEEVVKIKKRIMTGEPSDSIVKHFAVTDGTVRGIRNLCFYNDVIVDGFEEWAENFQIGVYKSKRPERKLSKEKIMEIYEKYFEYGVTQKELTKEYDVSKQMIHYIVHGKKYKDYFKAYQESHSKPIEGMMK